MSTAWVDHYEVLGIAPSATADEIKAAYRREIRAAHPDVTGRQGSVEAATRVNVARDVLLDPSSRRRFDYERAQHRRPARRPYRPAENRARSSRPQSAAWSSPSASGPAAPGRDQRAEQPPRGEQASAGVGPETAHAQTTSARGRVPWVAVLTWSLAAIALFVALFVIMVGLGAKGLGTLILWADRLTASTPASFELGHVRLGNALVGFGWYVMRIAIALFMGVGLLEAILNRRGDGGAATPGPTAA